MFCLEAFYNNNEAFSRNNQKANAKREERKIANGVNPLADNSVAAPELDAAAPPVVVAEPEVTEAETLGEVAVGTVDELDVKLPLMGLIERDGETMLAEELLLETVIKEVDCADETVDEARGLLEVVLRVVVVLEVVDGLPPPPPPPPPPPS